MSLLTYRKRPLCGHVEIDAEGYQQTWRRWFASCHGAHKLGQRTKMPLRCDACHTGSRCVGLTFDRGPTLRWVVVFDTGPGIPEIEREDQRFYRSDKSRNTKGLGLG